MRQIIGQDVNLLVSRETVYHYGPQHDLWIASSELSDCEALDRWYQLGGDRPDLR
jgi:hypothetical protein